MSATNPPAPPTRTPILDLVLPLRVRTFFGEQIDNLLSILQRKLPSQPQPAGEPLVGLPGDFRFDGTHLYVCVGPDNAWASAELTPVAPPQ